MHWIDRAEAKFGHLAISGLLRYIAALNALCFVLIKLNPQFAGLLVLDPALVREGQVWRLVTFIFIPAVGGQLLDWLFAAMYILFLVTLADGLDQAMGSFRLMLFYLLGMAGTAVAAFITNANLGAFLLNASLLFAFARFNPDLTMYVMFVLPLKMKWIAWILGAFVSLGFLGGTWGYRAAVIAALGNFFLFFGRDIFQEVKHRQEVSGRRERFEKARVSDEEALHQCTVCGRTELVAPELDFRVARDGEEYCSEHLPKQPPTAQA
jgi:hypothetical protein